MESQQGEPRLTNELIAFQKFALAAVVQSREIIQTAFAAQTNVEFKSDGSVLTETDLAVERLLRGLIEETYPTHTIIGEEYDSKRQSSVYEWTIDPIDGTQNFATGLPTFSTLISLRRDGRSVLGVIDHPALGICYHAAEGLGAYCNGKRISIGDARSDYSIIATSTRGNYQRTGQEQLFDKLLEAYPDTRIYYDSFPYGHVAQGHISAMVEFNLKLWDLSPVEVLIREAGGVYLPLQSVERANGPTLISAIFGNPDLVGKLQGQFR